VIVCIDIGLKRIGVAVALSSEVVVPSEPILRKNRNQAAREVSAMLLSKNASVLVVGVAMGGSAEDEMRRRTAHFVSLLDFGGRVEFVDESFSSVCAASLVKDRRDGKFDSVAACEILRRYLQQESQKRKI